MSAINLNATPSPAAGVPHSTARIIHIIPATGWSAEYQDTPEAIVVKHALICWALVEGNSVIGVISAEPRKQTFATEWGNFIGYKYEK